MCISDFSYTNRISDEQFYGFLSCFPDNQFISVNLDNVNWIENKSICLLTEKNSMSLQFLNIDGESNTDAVFDWIAKCCNLKSLIVNFAQGLTDEALNKLSSSQILHEICLRKGNNFTNEGLSIFLSTLDFSQLQDLNLSECSNLSNGGAFLIATNCPNLKNLSLCWCWEIDETGIIPIVTTCNKMETMDLTGMHQLTGECFLLIPETMPNLRHLKLEMCNNIQDDILNMIVIRMKGKLEVINYYFETIVYDDISNADYLETMFMLSELNSVGAEISDD